MTVKMSVVVPVYNTGEFIEPCLGSLLSQSLAPADYEVILVDDGSTDGTPARIDRAAAEHANVTAIHIPNSGWPGRPRNVGIDAAKGEYVYFVDHDDSLAPEALERMYAMAVRNDADVVIGKIVGHGRRVPPTLFRRSYEQCTVETAPLMESMTPHKGFRRDFLDEHHIRFPEGRRRLEDHVFVVEAYLRATTVSVLSTYTCYHHIARPDAGNAGFERLDPRGYFNNLREAIDVAEQLTEPGPRRDLVMRRWYRVEMLNRVGGRAFAKYPDAYRRQMYAEIRKLALERFNSSAVWEELDPQYRARSALLRAGRFDDLLELADYEAGLALSYRLERVDWHGEELELEVSLGVVGSDGRHVIAEDGDEARLRVPVAALDDVDLTVREREPLSARLVWRHRVSKTEHSVHGSLTPMATAADGGARHLLRVRANPVAMGGGPLKAGVWDVFVQLRDWGAGGTLTRRMGADRAPGLPRVLTPGLVGRPPRVVVPYWTDKDNYSVELDPSARGLADVVDAATIETLPDARSSADARVRARLTLHVSPDAASDLRLRVEDPEGRFELRLPVSVSADKAGCVVEGQLPEWAPRDGFSLVVPDPQASRRLVPITTGGLPGTPRG